MPGSSNATGPGGGQDAAPGPSRPFVRSRKRFKVYTWKYKRTLGPSASVVLLLNQIFGFGMNVIPAAVTQYGPLPVLICNLLICTLASLCSLMMLEAMTLIPHNSNFEQRIEYNSLVKYYLSNFAFRAISLLHYVGDFCSIVFGISTFARLIDSGVAMLAGGTMVIQVLPLKLLRAQPPAIYGGNPMHTHGGLHAPVGPVVTVGYLICVAICLLVNANTLEGIRGLNYLSLAVLMGCIGSMALSARGSVPPRADVVQNAIGARSFLELLFIFVDNYSLCNIMPSWANEMNAAVRPAPTLWGSALGAAAVYALLGLLHGACDDVFSAVSAGRWGALTVGLFIVFTAVPDVVFGCISLRYNLLNIGYCDGDRAYLWGCVAPFAFSWLFLRDAAPQRALGAIGLTASLVCNFFVPIILYLVANGHSAPHWTQGAPRGRDGALMHRISRIFSVGKARLSSGLAVPALVGRLIASGAQSPPPAERVKDAPANATSCAGGSMEPLDDMDAVGVEEIASLRAVNSLLPGENFLKSITLGLTPTGSINSLFKSMTVSLAGSRMGSRLASRMGSFFRGASGAPEVGSEKFARSAESSKEFSPASRGNSGLTASSSSENFAPSGKNSKEFSSHSEGKVENISAASAEKPPGGPPPDYASFRIVRNSKVLTTDELFNAFNRPSKVYAGQGEISPEAKDSTEKRRKNKSSGPSGPRVKTFPVWASRHQLALARFMCLAIGALAIAQPLLYIVDAVK